MRVIQMSKKRYAVAIDGPSGAGKSTLARAVAERLGILYVDTGAIYRTIGLYVQRCGVDPKDAPAVLALLPEEGGCSRGSGGRCPDA